MTGLAELLNARGEKLLGYDDSRDGLSEFLKKFSPPIPAGSLRDGARPDRVVFSPAFSKDHPERQRAAEFKIFQESYPAAVGKIFNAARGLAVAGTHGKTTTTAMLAAVLAAVEEDFAALVGAPVLDFGKKSSRAPRRWEEETFFALEACEYQNSFLNYQPAAAIFTNIDHDHLDFFPTEESYREAFRKLMKKIRPGGTLILRAEDLGKVVLVGEALVASRGEDLKQSAVLKPLTPQFSGGSAEGSETDVDFLRPEPSLKGRGESASALVENPSKIQNPTSNIQTFSSADPSANFFLEKAEVGEEAGEPRLFFSARKNGAPFGDFSLRVPGRHNAENALAVCALADSLGFPVEKIRAGLANFRGTARRQEFRGKAGGAWVFDDYAHHPAELRATLKAFREFFPKRRLVAAFQSHTHERTRSFLREFAKELARADLLFLPEVYSPAREKGFPNPVSAAELAAAIREIAPGLEIRTGGDLKTTEERRALTSKILAKLREGDLLLCLGAGETDKLAGEILAS
jgi:UDP-N-acetylmuramate--alanine ligase